MTDTVVIEGEVSLIECLDGEIGLYDLLDGEDGIIYEVSTQEHDTYHGSYDFIPSADRQVIPIADMIAETDIIIEAIPNNYGLITWDGSVITVS